MAAKAEQKDQDIDVPVPPMAVAWDGGATKTFHASGETALSVASALIEKAIQSGFEPTVMALNVMYIGDCGDAPNADFSGSLWIEP